MCVWGRGEVKEGDGCGQTQHIIPFMKEQWMLINSLEVVERT
jgi:hypothetical protein